MEEVERGSIEKSLIDLQTENQQLKAKIEQYEKGLVDQLKDTIAIQLAQLKVSNEKIEKQINAYAPIAEDVWGLRVFEKAKSYLIGWITLGGLTVLIAGGVLFVGAWKYAVGLIDAEVKMVSETEMPQIVQKEAAKQVGSYFEQHNDEIVQQVQAVTIVQVRQLAAAVQSKQGYGLSPTTGRSAAASVSSSPVDYASQMGPVRQQGGEGAVVGFAIAYALEYQVRKTSGQIVRLSPREIYNLARSLEGTPNIDAGALIRDGVKVVQTEGAVLEVVWPYKAGEFSTQPPPAFGDATRYKVKHASNVKDVDQIKAALSTTGPVVTGITVYPSFHAADVTKSGMVPLPKANESIIGGHAICVVGYDDSKKLFKFINSWGTEWGDNGYGYLPYDYIKDNSDDAWVLVM